MRIHSLAIGAVVLCALTTMSISQMNISPSAMRVQAVGAADPSAVTHFNVYLPLTHQDALEQLMREQTDPASASYHQWLTPAQFKAQFGPNRSDVATVTAALLAAGFTITAEHSQSLEVEGPVLAVERTFATHLMQVRAANGRMKFAAAEHHLTLPDTLASMGAVVPEFTTHLAAHVHSRRMGGLGLAAVSPLIRLSSNDSFFYPNDLNEAYQSPSFRIASGAGARIGVVISSVIDPADLAKTFNSSLNLGGGNFLIQAYSENTTQPVPTVTIRPVNGGSGPFDPTSDDGLEASADTQMSLVNRSRCQGDDLRSARSQR